MSGNWARKKSNNTVLKFPERHAEAKYDFARRLVGTPVVSTVAAGQKSVCTNWLPTKNGRGVWLVLQDGSRVYRECPGVKGARA